MIGLYITIGLAIDFAITLIVAKMIHFGMGSDEN